jgi:hypothetical protein
MECTPARDEREHGRVSLSPTPDQVVVGDKGTLGSILLSVYTGPEAKLMVACGETP